MPKCTYTYKKSRIEKNYNYTYLITNINSGMMYIGVRSCNHPIKDDFKYMSSSNTLKKIIKLEGIENFRKDILFEYSTRLDANFEEIRLQKLYDVGRNLEFYNKCIQTPLGFDNTGTRHSEETIKKRADSNRGQKRTPETCRRISESNTGRKNTPESIKRIKEGIANMSLEETKQMNLNRSKAAKNRPPITEKTRQKLILASTGRYHPTITTETRKRMSISGSGISNSTFEGYYITPWGKYTSPAKALEDTKHKISPPSISRYCKNNVTITKLNTAASSYLTESDLGKTTRELGFSFEPAVRLSLKYKGS